MKKLYALAQARYNRLLHFFSQLHHDWKSHDLPVKICIAWITIITILTGMLSFQLCLQMNSGIFISIIGTLFGCFIGLVLGFLSSILIASGIFIILLIVYFISLAPVIIVGTDSLYFLMIRNFWDKVIKKV